MRQLVKEGRLELVSGGYVQHDEATTTYNDILVNMMTGHRFLKEEFGIEPRIGWQMDAYGHSDTSARLFAEMGMDALFIGRGDTEDKEQRI